MSSSSSLHDTTTEYVVYEELGGDRSYISRYRDEHPALLPPTWAWTPARSHALRVSKAKGLEIAERLTEAIKGLGWQPKPIRVQPSKGGQYCGT